LNIPVLGQVHTVSNVMSLFNFHLRSFKLLYKKNCYNAQFLSHSAYTMNKKNLQIKKNV
jgi:hypothetical protein